MTERIIGLSMLVVFFSSINAGWAAPAFPTPATQTLLTNTAGLRAIAAGEGMSALTNATIIFDNDPGTTTDQFVANYLAVPQNRDALGVENVTLTPLGQVTTRSNRHKIFTYVQTIEGLPVFGTVVKIPVLLGATEKISYIGTRLVPLPSGPLPIDAKTEAEAKQAVDASAIFGPMNLTYTAASKVVHRSGDDSHHRCWRFNGSNDEASYLFLVDTNTAGIIHSLNLVVQGTVSGQVTGFATPGTIANDENNPLSFPIQMDMSGIRVTLNGGAQIDYADSLGNYSFPDVPDNSQVTVESTLVGESVTVNSSPLRAVNLLESQTVTVVPAPAVTNVDLTFNALSGPDPGNPNHFPSEYDTAQVNAFVSIPKTQEWCAALLPDSVNIGQNISCTVNIPDHPNTCNAFHRGGTIITVHCDTDFDEQCNSLSMSSVLSHEVGHVLVDLLLDEGVVEGSFNEGAADVLSTFMWNTPCLAENSEVPPLPGSGYVSPCLRHMDEPGSGFTLCFAGCGTGDCEVQLDDPRCALSCFFAGGTSEVETHCAGLALAGAFWDLREALLPQLQPICSDAASTACTTDADCPIGHHCGRDVPLERLFADFLLISDGALDQSVLAEVLSINDDDGNLSTPAANGFDDEIRSAFMLHGWIDPTAPQLGVEVAWVGPDGFDPIPGTHFFVHDEVIPPNVELVSKVGGSPPQTITKWIVGRKDPSTQQPLSLGTIFASWPVTGAPFDITVQVGGDAPQAPCQDVNIIDISAQSASTWSNIELSVLGSIHGRAQCFPTGADGGRISGTVGGDAHRIRGYGIGTGAAGAGALDVGGFVSNTVLTLLSSDAATLVTVGKILNTLTLSGAVPGPAAHFGNITVDDDLGAEEDLDYASINILGNMFGNIMIGGNIGGGSLLQINGDMHGGIQLAGTVLLGGVLNVTGQYYGNICAANTTAGSILPNTTALCGIKFSFKS